jgi:hypothetical protein
MGDFGLILIFVQVTNTAAALPKARMNNEHIDAVDLSCRATLFRPTVSVLEKSSSATDTPLFEEGENERISSISLSESRGKPIDCEMLVSRDLN